ERQAARREVSPASRVALCRSIAPAAPCRPRAPTRVVPVPRALRELPRPPLALAVPQAIPREAAAATAARRPPPSSAAVACQREAAGAVVGVPRLLPQAAMAATTPREAPAPTSTATRSWRAGLEHPPEPAARAAAALERLAFLS